MTDPPETDFHARANKPKALSSADSLWNVDIITIAEEAEGVGRSERNQPTNCHATLMTHRLKWQIQPGLRGHGWRLTIRKPSRRSPRVLA